MFLIRGLFVGRSRTANAKAERRGPSGATGKLDAQAPPRAVRTRRRVRSVSRASRGTMLSSLPLQVFLYFNGWYDVIFTLLMIVLYIWKGTTLPYPPELDGLFAMEVILIFILAAIEWARIFLSTAGNKTERVGPLLWGILLGVPAIGANIYYLFLQVRTHARDATPLAQSLWRPVCAPAAPAGPPLASSPVPGPLALHAHALTAAPPAPRADLRVANRRDPRIHQPWLHRAGAGPLPPHHTHIHQGSESQLSRSERASLEVFRSVAGRREGGAAE